MYDAVIVVSFGGPERREDVMPFLENVVRGRNVARERLLEVAEHYYHFGGISPANAQIRALIAALVNELNRRGPALPVYWGNRNWHPLLADTVGQMKQDGVGRALAFFTSPYGSYSSCRRYLEALERARTEVGAGAPRIDKLRAYFNHPGFVGAVIQRVREALERLPEPRRSQAELLLTAHSIPTAMAANCPYEAQLRESSRLVAAAVGDNPWHLVYQSRSGPPSQPWLEPDVCEVLEQRGRRRPSADVVIVPIGFISDHMEVVYDLDVEARQVAERCGLNMIRAGTVGTHPSFVSMIRELIVERTSERPERLTLGHLGPSPDTCPVDCCRPPSSAPGARR